ncbi:MAG: DNA-binding protein [Mycobacteriales bacterium]
MDEDDLRQLPVVVDLLTAASVLGIGRTSAYELVRTGRWPTPVLRLGSSIRVPTAALRDLLNLSTEGSEAQAHVAAER